MSMIAGDGGVVEEPRPGVRQRVSRAALNAYARRRRNDDPPAELDGRRLDPAVHALVQLAHRGRSLEDDSVEARRRSLALVSRLAFGPRYRISVWERTMEGPDGPIRLRLYRPHGVDGVAPAVVYFHGGGWVVGDLDTHDRTCRRLAVDSRSVVVSVDYRLAPEHRAPAAVDDAVAAFRWVVDHAGEFGVDAERVGVAGDSAGGNLAAIVAQRGRDEPPQPIVQLLVYPAVDVTMTQARASPAARGYLLEIDDMTWFRGHYIPEGADLEDPGLSPLCAPDLSGLAPAIVATAGFDPLLPEGRSYAEALAAAGNVVVYRCFDDQIHGFVNMTPIVSSQAAAGELGRLCGAGLRGELSAAG